jgi:hypothetical protein
MNKKKADSKKGSLPLQEAIKLSSGHKTELENTRRPKLTEAGKKEGFIRRNEGSKESVAKRDEISASKNEPALSRSAKRDSIGGSSNTMSKSDRHIRSSSSRNPACRVRPRASKVSEVATTQGPARPPKTDEDFAEHLEDNISSTINSSDSVDEENQSKDDFKFSNMKRYTLEEDAIVANWSITEKNSKEMPQQLINKMGRSKRSINRRWTLIKQMGNKCLKRLVNVCSIFPGCLSGLRIRFEIEKQEFFIKIQKATSSRRMEFYKQVVGYILHEREIPRRSFLDPELNNVAIIPEISRKIKISQSISEGKQELNGSSPQENSKIITQSNGDNTELPFGKTIGEVRKDKLLQGKRGYLESQDFCIFVKQKSSTNEYSDCRKLIKPPRYDSFIEKSSLQSKVSKIDSSLADSLSNAELLADTLKYFARTFEVDLSLIIEMIENKSGSSLCLGKLLNSLAIENVISRQLNPCRSSY